MDGLHLHANTSQTQWTTKYSTLMLPMPSEFTMKTDLGSVW